MSEKQEKTLEERMKALELLQRNTRIAIIILVGYSIYDVVSMDSGSDIIFAHKVKAREFELIDGQGTVFGNWRVFGKENIEAGLMMENGTGQQVRMTAEGISLTEGRVNPSLRAQFDEEGVHLYDNGSVAPSLNSSE
jgi:hypothetical protein